MSEQSEYAYDVFVSYSPTDEEWVWDWLVPRLQEAGLALCTDQESFHPGVPRLVNVEKAVTASRHTLLVLSPAWVEGEWERFAGLLARSEDPVGQRRRTIPLLRERCKPDRAIARLIYADFTDPEKWDGQLERLVATLEGHGHRTAFGPPLGALLGLEAPTLFPFRPNLSFVGREEELTALHDLLDEPTPLGVSSALTDSQAVPKVAGLIGLGGIGKTQLAVEYIYRYRDAYPGGVFWINAAEPLAKGFVQAGRTLCGNGSDKPRGKLIRTAADHLRSDPDTLLVLDNLPDPGLLNLPIDGVVPAALPCRLLFTTRHRDLSGFRTLEVGILPPDEALRLLLHLPADQPVPDAADPRCEAARAICAVLGYLPLALAIASAHLARRPDMPLAAYHQELLERGALPVLDDPRGRLRATDLPTRHIAAVAATLASQWDALESDDARRLLRVAGQLPEAALIPAARLGLLTGLDDREGGFFGSTLELALQELKDASLVEELRGRQVRLHPLVREFASGQTPEAELPAFHRRCAVNLASAYEDVVILEDHCARRGVDALQEDLIAALDLVTPRPAPIPPRPHTQEQDDVETRLYALLRLLQREAHNLRGWDRAQQPAFFAQQVYYRAAGAGLARLASGAVARLGELDQPHLVLCWRAGRGSPALVHTLVGHADQVRAVAVTADGRRAISASDDGTLKVWDLQTGKVEGTFGVGRVRTVAVTLDGRHAISASEDGTLQVWDLQRREAERILDLDWEDDMAVTPDDRYGISVSDNGILKVWDVYAGREERTLATREVRVVTGHEDDVRPVVVTRDGGYAISTSHDGILEVWDLEIAEAERTFDVGWLNDMAVAPDGRYAISASDDGTLKVWNLETGQDERTLTGHEDGVNAVAVTLDGQYAISASDDGTLKVWNLETGQDERTLTGHEDEVNAVAVTPDGRWAVSASWWHGTLKVWDLQKGKEVRTFTDHEGTVDAVAVTPDGRYAISSHGGTLKVWELQNGHTDAKRTLAGHADEVQAVAVTPDGRYAISASRDTTLRIWDLRAEPEDTGHTFAGHENEVEGVAVTPDGRRVISASWDGTLKVWDLQTGQEERILTGHERSVRSVALTPDGRLAVSGSSDETLKVWNLQTGQEERTLTGHNGEVLAVVVTPDGRRAISGSTDFTLPVWNLQTGREERTLTGHKRPVAAIAVTHDGRHAVSASGDCCMLWDLRAGQGEPITDASSATAVAITPDGRYVIYNSLGGPLGIWDLQTGQGKRIFFEHEGHVRAVAVTPDGQCAVSTSDDHTLKVWELQTGRELATVALENAPQSVAVAPDGTTVLAGDEAGNLYCLRYVDPNAS